MKLIICTVDYCNNKQYALNVCKFHYDKFRLNQTKLKEQSRIATLHRKVMIEYADQVV